VEDIIHTINGSEVTAGVALRTLLTKIRQREYAVLHVESQKQLLYVAVGIE